MRLPGYLMSLLVTCFCMSSCKNEVVNTHFFSQTDTAFIFPDEFRRKKYEADEFENNSKWLRMFDEKTLFDDNKYEKYIRLAYWRTFDNPIIIRVEEDEVVIKENSSQQINSHFDTLVLTAIERGWLRNHDYYRWLTKKHSNDSVEAIQKILSIYPDIDDVHKKFYLRDSKGIVYEDSLRYIEKRKKLKGRTFEQLLNKADSIDFWSRKKVYRESVTDGSGFILEVKNKVKYNIIYCDNCDFKALINLRNELLKFANLKEDEIY